MHAARRLPLSPSGGAARMNHSETALATLAEGDLVDGKYRVLRLLGTGGMGAVYEGENLRIRKRVAIKVLRSRLANDKDLVERFEREAQAASRIGSAHVVEVFDLGDLPDGDRYMI